ncbi:MAG: hypothetical protein FIB06_01560 [Betaproteobacteria bacterium]|nr:hypothetical protein [Betaproteobacteria bacterium]
MSPQNSEAQSATLTATRDNWQPAKSKGSETYQIRLDNKERMIRLSPQSAKRLAVISLNEGVGQGRFMDLLVSRDHSAQETYLKVCSAYVHACLESGATFNSPIDDDRWGINNFNLERVNLMIQVDIVSAHNSGSYDALAQNGSALVSLAQALIDDARSRGASQLNWFADFA